jgi:hypothetical protein
MARLLNARYLVMLEFEAYSDESKTEHGDAPTFCVAGYCAPKEVWAGIEAAWGPLLAKYGLSEFHARLCCPGKGEYARFGKAKCEQIWREFRQIVATFRLAGFGCAVDLNAYDSFASAWEHRPEHACHDPYFLAVQHQLEAIALRVPNDLPLDERVAFVFDKRAFVDTEAKAAAILVGMQGSAKLPFAKRIGGIAFNDSKCHAGLQAADMLAYEVRRHFWEVVLPTKPKANRWQFNALRPMNLWFFNRDTLAKL